MSDERNSEGGSGRLRAIVADDDPLARRMIKEALQRANVVVIAEAQNGREAVELTLHYRPDVVLIDVVMPQPEQMIVILTSADDEEMALLGLRSGAAGFLTKDLDVDVLPRALQGVLNGEAAVSRRLTRRLVEHLRRTPDSIGGLRPVKSPLTPREWEVMDLIAQSLTTDQIAATLVLSSETVRTHVKNILRKLDVRSREEAVVVAYGLRSAEDE